MLLLGALASRFPFRHQIAILLQRRWRAWLDESVFVCEKDSHKKNESSEHGVENAKIQTMLSSTPPYLSLKHIVLLWHITQFVNMLLLRFLATIFILICLS